VQAALTAGLEFRYTVNGRENTFVPVRTVVDNPRVRVFHLRARDSGNQGTGELFVYYFTGQPTARFQFAFDFEELTNHVGNVTLSLRAANATNCNVIVYDGNPTQLLGAAGRAMQDGGGVPFEGCFQFTGGLSAAEIETQQAQAIEPLFGVVQHATWGYPWRVPVSNHYTQTQYNNYERYRAAADFTDPFLLQELTTAYYPGQAGDQPEFGQRLHGLTVARTDSRFLWWERRAAMRHRCRPIWYTEPNGDPVKMSEHPSIRSWDERPHFDASYSPDRLGRLNGFTDRWAENFNPPLTDTAMRWGSHRWQHTGWLLLQEDVLLTGNLMAQEMLRRVGEWYKVQVPDDAGRALARSGLFVAMTYGVTGDPSFVTGYANWMANYWHTQLWKARSPGLAPYHPLTVYYDSSNNNDGWIPVPPNTKRWFWAGWQDGKAVFGIDAMLRTGLVTGTPLAQFTELRKGLIDAVVDYGYKPDPENPCANGLRFAATIGLNSFCTPTSPGYPNCPAPTPLPFVPSNYCDSNQAHAGGDFDLWAISAARCGRQLAIEENDPARVARCNRIELATGTQQSLRAIALQPAWVWNNGPRGPGFDLGRWLGAGVDGP